MAMQAQDTFVAELADGTLRTVKKGEAFPDGHELVKRDAAAARANPDRVPLFVPLNLGEEDKPAPKGRAAKGGAA